MGACLGALSPAFTHHWSEEGTAPVPDCWARCVFPHRQEFAWKLLLSVVRTPLNISFRELCPTREFDLWAVSLLGQESEIPS